MISNCFVRQEATLDMLSNVTNFCSACYSDIMENEIVFYDMKSCCYLCEACQEKLEENLDIKGEPIVNDGSSLFF